MNNCPYNIIDLFGSAWYNKCKSTIGDDEQILL